MIHHAAVEGLHEEVDLFLEPAAADEALHSRPRLARVRRLEKEAVAARYLLDGTLHLFGRVSVAGSGGVVQDERRTGRRRGRAVRPQELSQARPQEADPRPDDGDARHDARRDDLRADAGERQALREADERAARTGGAVDVVGRGQTSRRDVLGELERGLDIAEAADRRGATGDDEVPAAGPAARAAERERHAGPAFAARDLGAGLADAREVR